MLNRPLEILIDTQREPFLEKTLLQQRRLIFILYLQIAFYEDTFQSVQGCREVKKIGGGLKIFCKFLKNCCKFSNFFANSSKNFRHFSQFSKFLEKFSELARKNMKLSIIGGGLTLPLPTPPLAAALGALSLRIQRQIRK